VPADPARLRAVTDVTQRDVDLGEVTLRVLEAGDPGAPAVLLCHGFPELAHSWRHQLPVLAAAGYRVIAPDQRGYGASSVPDQVEAYGIGELTGDLAHLLDALSVQQAVVVGHDWGALVAWEMARLHPERVRAVVGVSVPHVTWPARPTELMRAVHGDRFFYILYFQQVGPPERELEADVRRTLALTLHAASGAGRAGRDLPAELPPMEGTGFLSGWGDPPALPYAGPEGPWLTEEDLGVYAAAFERSGFFGPVSWYRNLDANHERFGHLPVDRISMPSAFIGGALDPVLVMDPGGVERMRSTLPDFRGAVVLDGVGHWTQQEAPAAFNEALLGMLASF